MNNFIVRTITGVLFVAVLVCSFLRPQAMVLLFALITGLTIWEFTGLVNERENVTVNRLISTVAGVYFFFAVAGFSSDLTPSAVFIPYLVSIIYLMVAELYLKNEDPIHSWAYTMMAQIYIGIPPCTTGLCGLRCTVAPVGIRVPLDERHWCIPVWFASGQT